MSSPWPLERLGNLATKIGSGATPRGGRDVYIEQGTAFIRSQNVYDNKFSFDGLAYISDDAAHGLKGVSVRAGDVLICITGESVTRTSLVDPAALPARVSQHVAIIRPDPEVLDNRYLKAALLSPMVKNLLNRLSEAGATRRALTKAHLEALEIPVPPLPEQRRIAGVLGALDDLIETNQRLIQQLDEAFVTSWLRCSRRSLDATTVGEHTVVSKGLSYKGAFLADTGLPMINLGSFGVDGRYKPSGIKFYAEVEVKERHRLRRGDLVVANTDLTQVRDILGRAVLVPFDQATSTHHTFQVQVPAGEAVRNWIFAALRQDSVRQRLISYATGTTVAALPADALLTQEIPWAPTAVIEQWFESAKHYLIARDGLADEAQDLARTRDELLPLLLSGRVSVREVAA